MTQRYWMLDTCDRNVIERAWTLAQYTGYDWPMYRSRISRSHIAWVIETPDDRAASRLALEFSNHLVLLSSHAQPTSLSS